MPNRTRMSSAIRTIAWPSCKLRLRGLIGVLGSVDRICSDDDVVADDLLDDWCDRLERVPEGHLDRLIAGGGRHVVASGAEVGRRVRAQAATRTVRGPVARGAWVGDEDPARVRGRLGRRTLRDAAVGQRADRAGRVVS